ncbi:heavy-metal-associated domain-containing protein [Brevibacterium luteolum]|uniref:heavy-metal-associated domain-containing protein n=1 Tax=Brevibacterium luteolum TaxID=199591 RepID=UPI001C2470EC|nr:heavy-metal-associated domain-containing protein [Brevibacterium luteolum]MBU8577617.1 heavy-metal-associated domain-containing protein [Brevibacterium luteolum]
MSTIGKLIGYAAILAVALFGAFGIGNAVGPVGPTADAEEQHGEGHDMAADEHAGHGGDHAAASGLALDSGGYRLGQLSAPADVGDEGEIAFTVFDQSGEAVTDFEVSHEQELHLVVVRADGSHFEHVHPERDENGEWTLPWTWDAAGTYRVYADIVPAETGESLTLSSTVQVAGDYQPESFDETVTTVNVDGYEVSLDGELTAGEDSPTTVSVSRDGEPVTELEPYMGAFGHLTGLRHGDLAYLHVHPHGEEPQPGDEGGPEIEFEITAPTEGRYLLYLDFQVDGQVHTAGFVVDAQPGSGHNDGESGHDHEEGDSHDHGE